VNVSSVTLFYLNADGRESVLCEATIEDFVATARWDGHLFANLKLSAVPREPAGQLTMRRYQRRAETSKDLDDWVITASNEEEDEAEEDGDEEIELTNSCNAVQCTPGADARLDSMSLIANCYSDQNAFKKFDDRLNDVGIVLPKHLREGDLVLAGNGNYTKVAEIGMHQVQGFPFALVKISTQQGSFTKPAGCRIVLHGHASETVKAIQLRQDDFVIVGTKKAKVTKVQIIHTHTELTWIRFAPDVHVETFDLSSYGLMTRGEDGLTPSAMSSWMSVVPQRVLEQASNNHPFSDSDDDAASRAGAVEIRDPEID
jgi:hypothetical protein